MLGYVGCSNMAHPGNLVCAIYSAVPIHHMHMGGFSPFENISENGNLSQVGVKIRMFETTN